MTVLQHKLACCFFVLILLANVVPVSGQSLVINELMQSNVDVIRDDLNDFPDSWVELFNAGSEPVSLSHYKLGNSDNPTKAWQLPSNVTVPAYGYQLVFCDKRGPGLLDKLNAADNTDEAKRDSARLHTDFRLESVKGCIVYLFKDEILIESASVVDTLDKQPAPNIAYGRMSDGSDKWGYELNTTPGYANSGNVCKGDHILGEPIFSEQGSVKTDCSLIQLTLSLPEGSPEGTRIFFTTSGKEPSEADNLYTGQPITIAQSTVVRAKLSCEGWLSPMSTTHSFIFIDRKLTLPVISISTNESYFGDSIIGIFCNNNSDNRHRHKNWRRPANLEYFEGERTKSLLNQLCEVRVGGGSTRENSRKTIVIYAHKRFGEKYFDHEFFPDQKPGLHKFKSLSLRNAGNDFLFLYMRDALAQRSMGMHVDLDWQAWRPAIVFINGCYYGMLNIRERDDDDYISANYDGLENIDMFENWDNHKAGDWDNLNRFTDFYHQYFHTMAEYEQWMDCSEFINMMIMNLYYCNLDFPGNNIVMWRPRTKDGRWRWIAKDVDYAMGLYGIPYTYEILKWFYDPNFDQKWHWNANGYPYTLLFRQLMRDQDFKNLFIERYAIYAGDFLNEVGFRKLFEAMYKDISYELSYYGPLIGIRPEAYRHEVEYVDKWAKGRMDEFMRQLCEFYKLETPIPLTINTASSENMLVGLTFNDHQLSEARYNGRYFKNHPIRLAAQAVDGKVVAGWCINRTDGKGLSVVERQGATLIMPMPDCDRLTIEPIFKEADDASLSIQ